MVTAKRWKKLAVPTVDDEQTAARRWHHRGSTICTSIWLLVLIGGSLLAGGQSNQRLMVSLAAASRPTLTPPAPSSSPPLTLPPPPAPSSIPPSPLQHSKSSAPPLSPSQPLPRPVPPPLPSSPIMPRPPSPLLPPPPRLPPPQAPPTPQQPLPCRDKQQPEWCSERAVTVVGTDNGGCRQRRVRALCAASCGLCPSPPTPPPIPPHAPLPRISAAANGGFPRTSAAANGGLTVAQWVDARFQHGGPSDDPAQAGVLVHLIDRFEDWNRGRPWALCESGCQNGFTHLDHWACSLVSRAKPDLYPGRDRFGFVLAPTTPILCAYSRDRGSGAMANGGCDGAWSLTELAAVLRKARGYNELIVGRDALAQLPGVIEAIVFVECSTTLPSPQRPAAELWSFCQGRRDNGFSGVPQLEEARSLQQAFLSAHGLRAHQVPLLRYTGFGFEEVP